MEQVLARMIDGFAGQPVIGCRFPVRGQNFSEVKYLPLKGIKAELRRQRVKSVAVWVNGYDGVLGDWKDLKDADEEFFVRVQRSGDCVSCLNIH